MDLTVAEQFYLLKKNTKQKKEELLKIVTWVVFGKFKQFGSLHEFSITKFHKVSIFLNTFLNLLKFLKFR